MAERLSQVYINPEKRMIDEAQFAIPTRYRSARCHR